MRISTYQLASKGRDEEALHSLQRLHGGRKANQQAVKIEYEAIVAQLDWERENVSNDFMDLFRTRPSLHRTMCAVMVQVSVGRDPDRCTSEREGCGPKP